MSHRICYTENVLNGRFACYAKRYSKYRCSLRGSPPDTLWRDAVDSSFLQKYLLEETFARVYAVARQSRIPPFRIDSGFALRDHHGHEADQQDRSPAIQRIFFGDSWLEPFSGSNHIAKIFETIESPIRSTTGQASRQPEGLSVLFAKQTDKSGIRFGFGGYHYLRETRRIANRIQSQKTRQTIVSSLVLLRSQSPRILAWFFAAWQYDRCHWSRGVHENLSGQSTQRYCQKPGSIPNGLRILWTKNCQIPRRVWLRLRHRCQRIFSDQSPSAKMQISTAGQWMGSWGILCQCPSEVGQSASLRGGSPSYSQRSCGSQTVDFVQRPQICLSCLYYQSANVAMAGVPVLQSKGNHREKQSGIPVRLSSWKNPNKHLDSQRRLFPIAFIRGQYCPLVQKNLSAKRISYNRTRYDTNRLFGFTGKINQTRQSEYFDVAKRLSSSPRVPAGVKQNPKIASAQKFSFLQVTLSCPPSRHVEKMAF